MRVSRLRVDQSAVQASLGQRDGKARPIQPAADDQNTLLHTLDMRRGAGLSKAVTQASVAPRQDDKMIRQFDRTGAGKHGELAENERVRVGAQDRSE